MLQKKGADNDITSIYMTINKGEYLVNTYLILSSNLICQSQGCLRRRLMMVTHK